MGGVDRPRGGRVPPPPGPLHHSRRAYAWLIWDAVTEMAPQGPPAATALRPRVRLMAVVIATDIEVGDWLDVGGRLREIEAVQETRFRGRDGWVHAVLMQFQGWTIVQVPASSPLKIRRCLPPLESS